MAIAKIAITIDSELLKKLDYYVADNLFKNRSQAIQAAVKQAIERLEHTRLARECMKMDKKFEQTMADENLAKDFKEWPEY